MIDRYLLRYFLAVIDQGNFSKAAATCNVSQPTLSAGIAKLEQALGQPLFLRTNRRVELTEAGARLVPHARRIEAEFAQAEREVRRTDVDRPLRLGVLTSLPAHWIERFLQRHRASGTPGRIEIVEARERDLVERLARGRIDVALGIVREGDGRFAAEPLFTEGYALALASHHPLAGLAVIEAEQLVNEPMIVRRHCELLPDTSRYFTARGVRPFFAARTTSDDRALAYVRVGLGLTVMPDCFAGDGVARPRLADFAFTRTIGLLHAAHAEGLRDAPALHILRTVIADRE